MFRTLEDFYEAFSDVVESTEKIFAHLTDANLNQQVVEGHRTLGGMAWHIVATVPDMMPRIGLGTSSVDPQSPPPDSADEIMRAYKTVTTEMKDAVQSGWTDDTLLKTDDLYGEVWSRGKSLYGYILHEVHHRGQMTILLRQAGSKVTGIFGPSKEEWSTYGMPEPAY